MLALVASAKRGSHPPRARRDRLCRLLKNTRLSRAEHGLELKRRSVSVWLAHSSAAANLQPQESRPMSELPLVLFDAECVSS